MKELSIEQKAKRYDEAIEKARIWKDKSGMPKDKQGILDDIFPELKESDDERIRKAISQCVEDMRGQFEKLYSVHHKDALDWLEKQAEHANFRNKIQIGDKVTRNRDGVLVNLSQLNRVAKIDERQGEQKPAWSEEDATHYNRILKELNLQKEMPINASVIEEVKSDIIWLKSLRPQNTWKPSDTQMKPK